MAVAKKESRITILHACLAITSLYCVFLLTHNTGWLHSGCTAELESTRRQLVAYSKGEGVSFDVIKAERQDCPVCAPSKEVADGDEGQHCPVCEPCEQVLKETQDDRLAEKQKYQDLLKAFKRLTTEKAKIDNMLGGGSIGEKQVTAAALEAAKKAVEACAKPVTASQEDVNPSGCTCTATEKELARYFDYEVRALCPDDWFFVQHLIFSRKCFSLPKRRCLARTPHDDTGRLPSPQSLWDQRALDDANVRWDSNECKSYDCLNARLIGDCRNCFNLTLERNRWKNFYRGNLKMADVIALKKGSLRIGLDAGGGSGSFAAQMAGFNVTILTTAMNVETIKGRSKGLPYMDTIALRGLVPLHVPHQARLPFFDNTLDVIHSVNSVKYLELVEFEELIMEWDRVVRPGGIFWFEMFYTPVSETPLYIAIIDMLGYNRLYWNLTPKPDNGEREGEHLYLNCILEKPVREG